ncbi:hypothetical protein LOAG_02035 [Loa loa]|uniref:Uncharacterized protein n=1 Tax=Loa loa TaxID=7209 RepID=A0A1S0U9G6_LOALO|nr:hypothetical protein LOAG_02035 [Loa loa]EFO26453.2 hypothetical protein LOAG_02035 [Loa loa]
MDQIHVQIDVDGIFFPDEVTPNYGTEGGASGEVVCPRGGARGKRAGNLKPSPRALLLQSSSLLSSPSIEASISGFSSTIVQGTAINTITTTIPKYISATVAAPAIV